MLTPRLKVLLAGMGFNTLCLFIRAVYRVIELTNGFKGWIIQTQVYSDALDGWMIVFTIVTLNLVHPGFMLYLQKKSGDGEQVGMVNLQARFPFIPSDGAESSWSVPLEMEMTMKDVNPFLTTAHKSWSALRMVYEDMPSSHIGSVNSNSPNLKMGGIINGFIKLCIRPCLAKESVVSISDGKLRVIGFESTEGDHKFFQYSAPLSAVVASPPAIFQGCCNSGGFWTACEGVHELEFEMHLPLHGVSHPKGPFHGQPGVAAQYIALVEQPIQATTAKQLFMGGSGKVKLAAALRRPYFISRTQVPIYVSVQNTTKKFIKNLVLTLYRCTVIFKQKLRRDPQSTALDDPNACQTNITPKPVATSTLEMVQGFSRGHASTGVWRSLLKNFLSSQTFWLAQPPVINGGLPGPVPAAKKGAVPNHFDHSSDDPSADRWLVGWDPERRAIGFFPFSFNTRWTRVAGTPADLYPRVWAGTGTGREFGPVLNPRTRPVYPRVFGILKTPRLASNKRLNSSMQRRKSQAFQTQDDADSSGNEIVKIVE
ncbi:hypothetical protein DFH08DRAFT_800484 [Mycena albidolilacea]|uniref:Uncharacterized protein n=1 Tax=Mycena albidolilacea TaxID=1033008 RepID=A0AAD7AJY2_9AGAR|nr:hypothetical protein DFH08DRAFT_800484 [Mycena albidolilacea]